MRRTRMPPLPSLRDLRSLHASCRLSCLAAQCRRPACALSFPSGQYVCIDCDKCDCFSTDVTRPDFIALYVESNPSTSWWLVVEMKSRVQHPRQIVQQLQAGADVIESTPQFDILNSPQRLVPVILHERGLRVADLQVINRSRISFRNRPHVIKSKRCGVSLGTLLC